MSLKHPEFSFKLSVQAVKRLTIGAVCLMGAQTVWAQDADGIPVGSTRIYPGIVIEYFGDSNVYAENTDEVDATGVRIKPNVTWEAERSNMRFQAGYEGNISRTGINSVDENNHELNISNNAIFSKRSQALVRLTLSQTSQAIGRGIAIGAGDSLDELPVQNSIVLLAEHTYGTQGAKGNLVTGLAVADHSYSGDEFLTQSSDYATVEPYVRLSLRLAGSTRGFVELKHKAQNYDDAGVSDRDSTRLFGGVQWDRSERFGGIAKVGWLTFDNGGDEGDDVALEASVYFLPVDYSRFTLTLNRDLYDLNDSLEATGSNGVTISDSLKVGWLHSWSSRVSHRANVTLDVLERGCASDNQIDLTTSLDALVTVRKWVGVGAGITSETRSFDGCDADDAATSSLDYTRNQFRVFLNLSI